MGLGTESVGDVMFLDATPEQIATSKLLTKAKNVAEAAFTVTERQCPIKVTGRTPEQVKADIIATGTAIKKAMLQAEAKSLATPAKTPVPAGNATASKNTTKSSKTTTKPALVVEEDSTMLLLGESAVSGSFIACMRGVLEGGDSSNNNIGIDSVDFRDFVAHS